MCVNHYCGPGWRSRYIGSLRAVRSWDRIPVGWGGRDFLHLSRPPLGPTQPPVQRLPDVLPVVKRPGSGVDHPPPYCAEVIERELYVYSPLEWAFPSIIIIIIIINTVTAVCLCHVTVASNAHFVRKVQTKLFRTLDWQLWPFLVNFVISGNDDN